MSCCLLATLMAQWAVSWPPRRQCDGWTSWEPGTATEAAIEITLVTLPGDDDEDGGLVCDRPLTGWAGPGWGCIELQIWAINEFPLGHLPAAYLLATEIKLFVSKRKSFFHRKGESNFLPLALVTISLATSISLFLTIFFSAIFRQVAGRGLPVHGRLRPAVAVRELPIVVSGITDGRMDVHIDRCIRHLSASSRMDGRRNFGLSVSRRQQCHEQ